ncbi:MAG: acylphosphatase [Tepidanaerobacteraceae bacterium]|jgi:acylphosphatase|nr:acylphosphatase [Tepidanaerobacteraceae bacterium]HQE06361.1 acylphosphatase [Tepidanaerobacteraceae bacterium]
MKKSACIHLYGIVQGVGMRYQVFRKASSLGLFGYVRNMSDGSVMIEVEGEEDSILFLVDYVKNDVRWAQVDDIVIKWGDHKNSYKRFEILG